MAEQKITLGMSLGIAVWITGTAAQATHSPVRAERLLEKPIITPQLHPSIGANIQGPSLVRVPDWVKTPPASTTSTLPITRPVTSASPMLMTYEALGASTLHGVCSSQIPIS